MGVFGAIVFSEVLITRTGEAQLPESPAVGAQLVGDQHLPCEALFPEQLAPQAESRPHIAPRLNEHLEDLALVVDGAPQVHFPAIRTTISSRCHRALRRGRPSRSWRAIGGPNFSTQRRTVS
jgi:hypothetical protein